MKKKARIRNSLTRDSQRILIRGVNWIGDSVLTLPAIRAVRKAFPDARISLLVKPWVSEIFKENPDIDEIISYDKSFTGLTGRLRLARMLRQKAFNKAILFQNAFDAALISCLSGIPERIGYKRDWRRLLLTKAVPVKRELLKQHHLYYYLNLLESIGIKAADVHPYMHLTDDEKERARNFINLSFANRSSSPVIGINPGATYGLAKRWLPERFAELIRRIIDELNGKIIIFGSPSEVEIADKVTKLLTFNFSLLTSHLLNLTGKTNLRELAALISECDVFITNDSGPMHMASALFVPVVAIFGSTDKSTTSPFGEGHRVITSNLPCSPCLERECPEGHLKCMTEITVDKVFSATKEVLPANRAIFLDRDGTLIEDKNYLNSFEELHILSGIKEELPRLKTQGFKLIGITNQSGIARGIVDETFIIESNDYLKKELNIDDFYYCPHHPDEHCPCRKPEPMLLLKARLKHRVNLKASYVIGDKESDVLLARRVGAIGILVLTGYDRESEEADFIAKNLTEAVDWILKQEKI